MPVDYENSAVGEMIPDPAASGDRSPVPAENPPLNAAVARFRSCRWRKPPEDGNEEYCTHRDVLPMTGAHGFDPEAWCPDCAFYKLRRTPRKNPNY